MWIRLIDWQLYIYISGVLVAMIGIVHITRWWKMKLVQKNFYLYANKPWQYDIFKRWYQFETKYIFTSFKRVWLSWYSVIEELIIMRTVTILFEKLAQLEIKSIQRGYKHGETHSK